MSIAGCAQIKRLHQVAVALMCLMYVAPSSAQNFYKGMEAYKQADYATARREWEPLAVRGDQIAQYNLGVLHDSGLGVPVDKSRAILWYRKSAAQGFAQALNNLGRMYYMGDGIPQDYVKAAGFFQQAAAQGIAFSNFFLGMIYAGGGPGVNADPIQAYKWLSIASALHTSPGYRHDALSSRDLVAQGMTQAHIAVAEQLAHDWIAKFQQRRVAE